MKKIIHSKNGLLIFGLSSSLMAEIIELFSGLGQYGQLILGLILSLLILYLSIKWEHIKNINSFYQIIKNIIPDIKTIRKKHDVN